VSEPKADRSSAGEWGEEVAAAYLKQAGLAMLGSRVRFGAREELDLVARDGETLVFVEVKMRGSEAYGRPASAVDRKKRERMSRAALHYLRGLGFPRVYVRFDVVEVVGKPAGGPPLVRHIRNAFTMDPRYRLPY
jgi:putative endonuclease